MSKQARIKGPRPSQPPPSRPDRLGRGMVAQGSAARWGIAAAILAGAIVLAVAVTGPKPAVPASARVSSGVGPAFSQRDVLTGRPITSAGLRGHDVLLFFSEGVMCQACFEQIQSLQQRATELRSHGLTLINITTDSPEVLRQAVQEYHINTPMISDQEGTMSTAYGALGQGMHPNTDGHTFVLLDRAGRIRWRRDYTTMYVPPNQLLTAIPNIA
jgi:peroxiredoxin